MRIIRYDDISYREKSGSIARSLDANIRNTTPIKTTGFTILYMYQPSFRDDGPGWINNTKNVLHNMEFLL